MGGFDMRVPAERAKAAALAAAALRQCGGPGALEVAELLEATSLVPKAIAREFPIKRGLRSAVTEFETAYRNATFVEAYFRIKEIEDFSVHFIAGRIQSKAAIYEDTAWPIHRHLSKPPPSGNSGIDDLLWRIKKLKFPMQGIGHRRICEILLAALPE